MTKAEENYLKTIYHLSANGTNSATTNAIAEMVETKASSVTDMLKKLSEKNLIVYKKYQAVILTDEGRYHAKMIIRKHRLWEVFLVDKLGFTWDEVHDVAEQLEHIHSPKLIDRLDDFLGNPTKDPHGDPIPDAQGHIVKIEKQLLSELEPGDSGICVGVKDSSTDFLQYLDRSSIALGSEIRVNGREPFDRSLQLSINGKQHIVSGKIADNLFVRKV
mgnify:CR=1 FL=1